MATTPHGILIHYKRWATNGLNSIVAEARDRIPADDWTLVLRLLDHVQVVDEIFRHNLEARSHGYCAPRSDELPSFEAFARNASATMDWYASYVDSVTPEQLDERVAFTFSSGEAGCMTRGEMLLHVAMHAAGHRGQIGLLLQKNGIAPFPDRLTDFLAAQEANRQSALAQVTP